MNQKQNVKDSSTAIQAGGNINIGLSYSDVKEIVFDLFKSNFPNLIEEAKSKAEKNLIEYSKKLEESIKLKINEIDINKFKEPNVQYLLNKSINQASRKGGEINFDHLTEALLTSLGNNNNDLLNIVSEQVLDTLPKITSQQISIITIIQFFMEMESTDVSEISDTEPLSRLVWNLTSNLPENIDIHLTYLDSLGIIIKNQFQISNPYEIIKNKHQNIFHSKSLQQVEEIVKIKAPDLNKIAQQIELKKLGIIKLTPAGMLIALINMKSIFPRIDYNLWIK